MFLATFIWGAGFVGTRWTLIDFSPTWSNALRFVIAGSMVSPYLLLKLRALNFKTTIVSAFIMYLALHFQTLGIAQTSLAKSGFLTVFYALFTPLLLVLFFKEKIKRAFWGLVLVALLGVALLCELSWSQLNRGDAFVLLSALFFAAHILWIDRFAKKEDPVLFNFWQCFFIAFFAVSWAFWAEGGVSVAPLLNWSRLGKVSSLSGFLILSVFSSLIAFSIQLSAQKLLKAHIVSLIFLLECVFAAFFGYLFFEETLSKMAFIGAFLVILAVALVPRFCKSSS